MPRRPAAEAKAAPPDPACKLAGRNAAGAAQRPQRHCQLTTESSATTRTTFCHTVDSESAVHFWVATFPSRHFLSLARWDVRLVMEGTGSMFYVATAFNANIGKWTVASVSCGSCF
jgi:hypothetical protein